MIEYMVQIVAGTVRHDFMAFDNYDDAFAYCSRNWWMYCDENEFIWDLEIDERVSPY